MRETVEEWVARGGTITVLPPGPLPEIYQRLESASERHLGEWMSQLAPDGETDGAQNDGVEQEV